MLKSILEKLTNNYIDTKYSILMSLIFLLSACSFTSNTELEGQAPIALRVGEGFINPIGYYEQKPQFSWQIAPSANYQFQQAYQIRGTLINDNRSR